MKVKQAHLDLPLENQNQIKMDQPPVLYSGSVKEVCGPILVADAEKNQNTIDAVLLRYSDAFSVFDWGRMPDILPSKGKSLAYFGALLFEELEKPQTWEKWIQNSLAASAHKKDIDQLSGAQEILSQLRTEGLRTHYFGWPASCPCPTQVASSDLLRLENAAAGFGNEWIARAARVLRPKRSEKNGVWEYQNWNVSKLKEEGALQFIPVECVFRLGVTEGSSYLSRNSKIQAGHHFSIPLVEWFTKLEPLDRYIVDEEVSALTPGWDKYASLRTITILVSLWLDSKFKALGLELVDGKIEWAYDFKQDRFVLVDAIGPDELRILPTAHSIKEALNVTKITDVNIHLFQLSKEFLRNYYRHTTWYTKWTEKKNSHADLSQIKKNSEFQPPLLPENWKNTAVQLYRTLVNEWAGKMVYPQTADLPTLLRDIYSCNQSVKEIGADR